MSLTEPEFLTSAEIDALDVLATFATRAHRILGDGNDWAEAADKIHQLQSMLMGQAASRAYPSFFRLLGNST